RANSVNTGTLSNVDAHQRADPAIYVQLREHALQLRLSYLANNSVQVVLMDWNVSNGTATVLAAADGTASVYLSSGGGFLGGGQKYPTIRDAALRAIHLATNLLPCSDRLNEWICHRREISFFI
ncbi:MAG TPA: hypothetical protein VF018_08530, partial [Acidobacteriaceae bacterium]